MNASIVEPHVFVVFGGTGDLMQRKLLPALYHIGRRHEIARPCTILGVARSREVDDAAYRRWAREALQAAGASDLASWCDDCVHHAPLGEGADEDYAALAERIEALDRQRGAGGNRVLYLALPPDAVRGTLRGLGAAGLTRGAGWTRVVVEKPFGLDAASARELNALLHAHFDETQIYRIDHYLGKETVQNLLVFRFANPIFESIWNRDRIESVHVTVAESLGVETRARSYERSGALSDMLQNHVSQLVSLIGMEVPGAFDAQAVRYEKVKLLGSIAPLGPDDVVFGQYAGGEVDGRRVPAYREEPGVAAESRTETFVAARLRLDTWRWQGVPFYVRTGKRLARRQTWISIRFAQPPVRFFESLGCGAPEGNELVLSLQPDEGFALHFDVKRPAAPLRLRRMPLSFRYSDAFGVLPDAYETLLLDVMTGDQTLFVRADETEASWRLYGPLLEQRPPTRPYAAGSWGPAEADALLAAAGHAWHTPPP